MSNVTLTPDQEVERDWPEWAAEFRPRVYRARIELFAEFVAGQCQVLLGRHSETHRRQITAAV